jgi:hypothetical protein
LEICYKPGKEQKIADYLSRWRPCEVDSKRECVQCRPKTDKGATVARQCFIQAFARGAKPPPGEQLGPPGKCDKIFFGGLYAPDSILGSWGAVAYLGGERSGDRPAVGEENNFSLRLCGRAGRTKRDVDEGRSGDWLGWK